MVSIIFYIAFLFCPLIIGMAVLIDDFVFDGAIYGGFKRWKINNKIKEECSYIILSYKQIKNLYYLLKTRSDETEDCYPIIDLEKNKIIMSRTYNSRHCNFSCLENSSALIMSNLLDNIKYFIWSNKEIKFEKTKAEDHIRNRNYSNQTYIDLIDILEKEKNRHEQISEDAISKARRVITNATNQHG